MALRKRNRERSINRPMYVDPLVRLIFRKWLWPSMGDVLVYLLIGGGLGYVGYFFCVKVNDSAGWVGGLVHLLLAALFGIGALWFAVRLTWGAGKKLLRALGVRPPAPRLEVFRGQGLLGVWPRRSDIPGALDPTAVLVWGATEMDFQEPTRAQCVGHISPTYAVFPLRDPELRVWIANSKLDWAMEGGVIVLLEAPEIRQPRVYFLELDRKTKK